MSKKLNERHESLKNLVKNSCHVKLHIINELLNYDDKTHYSEGIKKRQNEIKEALEFLKDDGIKITIIEDKEESIITLER